MKFVFGFKQVLTAINSCKCKRSTANFNSCQISNKAQTLGKIKVSKIIKINTAHSSYLKYQLKFSKDSDSQLHFNDSRTFL